MNISDQNEDSHENQYILDSLLERIKFNEEQNQLKLQESFQQIDESYNQSDFQNTLNQVKIYQDYENNQSSVQQTDEDLTWRQTQRDDKKNVSESTQDKYQSFKDDDNIQKKKKVLVANYLSNTANNSPNPAWKYKSEQSTKKTLPLQWQNIPKINQKSKQLAEQRFMKMIEVKNENDEDIEVQRLLKCKEQFVQTVETCQNLLKQGFPIYQKKKTKKKEGKDEDKNKEKNKNKNKNQKKIAIKNEEIETAEAETQTDFKDEYPQQINTPEKNITRLKTEDYSDMKQSYYIPIQERAKYIVKAKQHNIQKKKKEKEEQELKEFKQFQHESDLQYDEEDNIYTRSKRTLKNAQAELLGTLLKNAQDNADNIIKQQQQGLKPKKNNKNALSNSLNEDFFARQKKYEEMKEQKRIRMFEESAEYTFAPRLSPQSRYIVFKQMEREQLYNSYYD